MSGYLIVDGVNVPVTSMALRKGKLWIFGSRPGPVRAASGPVTVFGEDGQGICQGGHCEWPEVMTGESLDVQVDVTVDSVADDHRA